MQEVVWSKEAKESLAHIYDYIYQDSPQNAFKVFNTFFELVNSLSNPIVEYAYDRIVNNNRYRSIPKWNYKIIYERKDNHVRIIDIVSTRQSPQRLENM